MYCMILQKGLFCQQGKTYNFAPFFCETDPNKWRKIRAEAACLCYRGSASKLAPETVAAGVHKTANTVKKCLGSLAAKKLIRENGTPACKCSNVNFGIVIRNIVPKGIHVEIPMRSLALRSGFADLRVERRRDGSALW